MSSACCKTRHGSRQHRYLAGLLEREALDVNRGASVDAGQRERREVQRVLVSEVDGAFVRVDLGEHRQPWAVTRNLNEFRRLRDERRVAGGRAHDARPLALSISQAAVIRPMWLNAWGKFPSSSPVAVSISSASSPRSLA